MWTHELMDACMHEWMINITSCVDESLTDWIVTWKLWNVCIHAWINELMNDWYSMKWLVLLRIVYIEWRNEFSCAWMNVMNACNEFIMCAWKIECINAWMNEWMNTLHNMWVKEWMYGLNAWINEWLNDWMDEWMVEQVNEWTHICKHDWLNEWISYLNEYMIEL